MRNFIGVEKMFSEVSATSPVSYKGVFDQSIYSQEDFLENTENRGILENEELLAAGLIEWLNKKKIKRLEDVILKNIEEKMSIYQEVLSEHRASRLVKTVLRAVPFIGQLPDSAEKEFWSIPRDEAKKELFKLDFQFKLLKKSINKEPIYDLEKKYVVMKRKIKSSEIKNQIEQVLLLCREEAVYLELLRRFIDNCLAMPNSCLQVTPPERLSEIDFFKHFTPELKNRLGEITTKLSFDSFENDGVKGSKRCIYYFHGDPGTGKSECARKLADLCGLPYFILPIRRVEDLSSQALEGSDRTMMAHNPGLLAKALMSKSKDSKSYLNAILILDDFDRVLLASEGTGPIPPALAFLLDYLDPLKSTYYSPYFQTFIDVSRLSIFITANQPIPSKVKNNSKDKRGFDPFDALRSRVSEVHFPNFSENALRSILDPIANNLWRKYGFEQQINRAVVRIPRNKDQLIQKFIDEAINRQKSCTSTLEPRDLQRQLEMVIIAHKRGVALEPLNPNSQAVPSIVVDSSEPIVSQLEAETNPDLYFRFPSIKAEQAKLAVAAGLTGVAVGVIANSKCSIM